MRTIDRHRPLMAGLEIESFVDDDGRPDFTGTGTLTGLATRDNGAVRTPFGRPGD